MKLLLGLPFAYFLAAQAQDADICFPRNCGKINPWSGDIQVPCSAASATLPSNQTGFPEFPFTYQGNFDLCATFNDTGLWTVSAGDLTVKDANGEETVYGKVSFDMCLPNSCNGDMRNNMLKDKYVTLMTTIRTSLAYQVNGTVDTGAIAGLVLGKDVENMYIFNEEEQRNSRVSFDAWSWVVAVYFLVLSLIVLSATASACGWFKLPHNGLQAFLAKFGLARNARTLFQPMKTDDFKALNGVRVLSISWIVMAHVFQFVFMAQDKVNPTKEFQATQSIWFFLEASAQRAVDTFFFLSGFLGAVALVPHFGTGAFNFRKYGSALFFRWMRLTPLYMSTFLFSFKILTLTGYRSFNPECTRVDLFLKRVFYLNVMWPSPNPFPGDNPENLDCDAMGQDWYLMTDMQCFLFAPFVVFLYYIGVNSTSSCASLCLKYGPLLLIIIEQIVYPAIIVLMGRTPGMDDLYSVVWERWAPYFIGLVFGMWHVERSKRSENWQVISGWSTKWVRVLYVSSVVIVLAIIVAFFALLAWCPPGSTGCSNDLFSGAVLSFSPDIANLPIVKLFLWQISPIIYGFGIAGFCYVLCLDKKYDALGLKTFLSSNVWTPFAKLSFALYIVHHPLIYITIQGGNYLTVYSFWNAVVTCFGVLSLANIVSIVAYILIERPFVNILSALFFGEKKKQEVEVEK
eukprot:CAMPEP_0203756490 /NCGR_PEP_ID=MMETSP0098-20131031/9769_1 /ASSEMBLY_ACC=CAM_ASM_000208 /TAXON_ID=96639 /ORGANISM=" , Strain NY0313808BC1" /LENGTH=684 /DNA_ID=CAMNT_0050648397 /DNA_START=574 /DNA_END=2625 /DNA_ORIENTATION=+